MKDNDQKKVNFFSNKQEESNKINPIKYNEEQILQNNLNFTNEDQNEEILLNRKRNFNNFNKYNNLNQEKIQGVNYLEFSEFKNPDKLYSLSSNKYSNSSIKNIGYSIIKEIPDKNGNIEFSENRTRHSNYKFSSGKKIITTIENTIGVKDLDKKVGIIENYYLEKTSEKEIYVHQGQNIRCNFDLIQDKTEEIECENEETQIYGNTKRNLNINDFPKNNIDFTYPFLKINNILQSETTLGIKENIDFNEISKRKYMNITEKPYEKKLNLQLGENSSRNSINQIDIPYGIKENLEQSENIQKNLINQTETPTGKKGNIEFSENRQTKSHYKFSSGRKTITTIENARGANDLNNMVGIIENYYLEKTSEKVLEDYRSQNIRCNFNLIKDKSEEIECENEETQDLANAKKILNLNEYPNKNLDFSYPYSINNNILHSESQNSLMDLKKKIIVKEELFSSIKKKRRESKKQAKISLEQIKEELHSQISESSSNELNDKISKKHNLDLNENEKKKDLIIKCQEEDIDKDINKINKKRNIKLVEQSLREGNTTIVLKPIEIINIDKYHQISKLENKATIEKEKINKNKDENEYDFQMEIPKENEFNIQCNSNFPDDLSEDIDIIRLKNNASFKSLDDEKIFKDNNINARKYFNTQDDLNNQKEVELIDLISEEHSSDIIGKKVKNHFKSDLSKENEKEKLENKILGLKSHSFRNEQEEIKNYDFEIIESNDNLLNKSFIEDDNLESKYNEDGINQINNKEEILNVSELKNEEIEQSLIENNNSSDFHLVSSSNMNKVLQNKINDKFPVKSIEGQILTAAEEEQKNKFKLEFEDKNYHKNYDENDNQEESIFSNYQMEPILVAAGNKKISTDKNIIDLDRNNTMIQKYEETEDNNVQKREDNHLDVLKQKKLNKDINSNRSSKNNIFEKNENFISQDEVFIDKNPQYKNSTYYQINKPIQNDYNIYEESKEQNLIEYPNFNNNYNIDDNRPLDNYDNLIEYPILDNQNKFIEYPYIEDYDQENYDNIGHEQNREEENEVIDKSNYGFKSHFSIFKNQINKSSSYINESNYVQNDENNVDNYNRIFNNGKNFNKKSYNEPFNNANLYVNNFAYRASNNEDFENENFNYFNYKNFFDDNENGINPLEKFSQFLKINRKNLINEKKRKRRNWRLFSNNKLHFIQSRDFNCQNYKRIKDFSFKNQYEAENDKNELENQKLIIKELEETLLLAVINRVLKHNNIDENFIKDINVFKNFYQNQLNVSEIKKLLIEENFVTQEKLDNFISKIKLKNLFINSEGNHLDMNKLIIIVVFIFSFMIALRLLGFELHSIAELILRIPFSKIFLIFSITFLIAFCTYALIKISSEIEKQNSKHIIIARKAQEIISIYLNKLKDYEFCKYYLECKFFMEMLSRELNISKKYFANKILPLIHKDNPEYRFIKFTDSRGKENTFWRLKNQ